MKAFTIWQPWATLIMVGAKPFEFRSWPVPSWLVGQDIVIHAGARAMKMEEIEDLLERLDDERDAWTTGLFKDKAIPVLERAMAQVRLAGIRKPPKPKARPMALFDDLPTPALELDPQLLDFELLPYSAGLGIVCVGPSVNGNDTAERFGHVINDSDRMDHANWGWPMLDIRPFAEPIPMKGAQGLWTWPDVAAFAETI